MNLLVNELQTLPALGELFRVFNSGKHLNRKAEPALWAELERNLDRYLLLFEALGFVLQVDGRGFAWFQQQESSANIGKTSKRLALLFMCLFDTQADEGKPLGRFDEWRIDNILIQRVFTGHKDLLLAEGLDTDELEKLLATATRLGFASKPDQKDYWQLLPAASRYLDHIQALAGHYKAAAEAMSGAQDDVDAEEDGSDFFAKVDDEEEGV